MRVKPFIEQYLYNVTRIAHPVGPKDVHVSKVPMFENFIEFHRNEYPLPKITFPFSSIFIVSLSTGN